MVLCAASSYDRKYYLDPAFYDLPRQIRNELQSACVLFTEEVGGILVLEFDEDGTLMITIRAREDDFVYDEIGAGLKIRALREEKEDLFRSLELYYSVFFGEEETDEP